MRARLLCFTILVATATGCDDERLFARVFKITDMAQTIGGPLAIGRPGDYMLENDRIRAIVHGRHNERATHPVSNGSLIDLDLQRPHHSFGVGKGADAFYELGAMANLKVSNSGDISIGPAEDTGISEAPAEGCARVSVAGPGENFMGVLGLLDFAMLKSYPATDLQLATDYDVCPGEPLIRLTSTIRFYGAGEPIDIDSLQQKTGLLDVLLGEHLGIDCAKDPCPEGAECDDLLRNLNFGTLKTEMKRCRETDQKVAGVLAGDLLLMSGKVNVFAPGSGFDHDSYIRSVFDSGGDIFSNPLSLDYVAAVGDDVSYVYFEQRGKVMIPVFSESFTVSMSNKFACPRNDVDCMKGKELRFRRLVSVGGGDVASALAGYYRYREIETGEVVGHVIDRRTNRPVSHTDVFALRLPKAWEDASDTEISRRSYEELASANRDESRSDDDPLGQVGVVSHFRTDVGLDVKQDGSFGGPIPPGRYVLVTRDKKRPASRLVPIQVRAGSTTRVSLFAGEHGTLEYIVRDSTGRSLPSKLTIGHCFVECARDEDCSGDKPYCYLGSRKECDTTADCDAGETCTAGGCLATAPHAGLCMTSRDGATTSADQCRPDQVWDAESNSCTCPTTARLPIELGGGRFADNADQVVLSAGGTGAVSLPPGTYQLVISRGMEYETVRRFVTIRPGTVERVAAVLPKVVDTDGWISADFHVHGPNSMDSGVNHHDRVVSYAAEGVELLTATDHDHLTDYGPTIYKLRLRPWIKSQVGVEVSPLDYGHYLGFPLLFDENAELNGAFHWRRSRNGEPDWASVSPAEIFKRIRELGSHGPDKTVVAIAHFYDHFTFYDLDPWSLELPPFNVLSVTNPVLMGSQFSGRFDAVEAFNGKGVDLIRRPTYRETRDYNFRLASVLSEGDAPYDERLQAWIKVSAAAQRDFLLRTPKEQAATVNFDNPDFECRCLADIDCGEGYICDARNGACVQSCSDDSHCDEALVTSGREACLPLIGSPDETRRTCQRTPLSCGRTAECVGPKWGSASEACIAVDASVPQERTCELICEKDDDCEDELRPSCNDGRCGLPLIEVAEDDDPCPTMRGTLDDWFQMLNHGIRRTVLGNSDSHSTYGIEAGLPRNYVRSNADLPGAIDEREIASRVKSSQSFATFGPFVELSVDGKGPGETVIADNGQTVKLGIKVQSPLWFDVDRIEIYRNGELIEVVSGKVGCDHDDPSCLQLPNDRVVNYDHTLDDTPQRDSWYAIVVMGADGKTLAPVYSSTPVARLGIFELIQRLTPLLPPLRSLRTPFTPSITVVRPYAVTNAVWVDIGGDGIEPLGKMPSWATPADRGEQEESSLAATPHDHDHDHGYVDGHDDPGHLSPDDQASAHDHRNGIERMRRDARQIMRLVEQGRAGRQTWQKALDALRYIR